MDRRDFLQNSGLLAGALMTENLFSPASSVNAAKKLVDMVGTGSRGIGMWGRPVIREFADQVEFVGLCDINPGRVEYARKTLGLSCPVFTDFDKMMKETKPERLLVMTVDGVHHEDGHVMRGGVVPRHAPAVRIDEVGLGQTHVSDP